MFSEAKTMRLRKMLHSKARPAKDFYIVNSVDGKQYRVVGRDAKQPEVGDVFQCVPASNRKSTLGRRTFSVVSISNTTDIPMYTLDAVHN